MLSHTHKGHEKDTKGQLCCDLLTTKIRRTTNLCSRGVLQALENLSSIYSIQNSPASGVALYPYFVRFLFTATPWVQSHLTVAALYLRHLHMLLYPNALRTSPISSLQYQFPIFDKQYGRSVRNQPSVLLVVQPDPSLPTAGGAIQAFLALDAEATSLISGVARTQASVHIPRTSLGSECAPSFSSRYRF